MTYEEKFDIVVKAIKEAKKFTPSGYNTKLKITHENRLQELDLDDISSILYQLQNDHKVIKMISTANAKFITGLDPWSEEQDYYALDALDSFDEWSITSDEHSKFYTEFRDKIAEIDSKLASLQRAEDEYYVTAIYLLELANRAYDLFKSSEIEERRQLLKLTLQNLVLDGKKVQFQAQKPFDTILNFADSPSWLPREDSNL